MYHTLTVQVKQKDRLYKWCDTNAHLANNLYNAALFRQRQMMSASKKEMNNLTPNELEILNEVKTLEDNTNRRISTSGIMSYTYLDALLKCTKNNDYYADGLPIHVAQNVLKEVCGAIKGYFASLKSYKSNPTVFNGKPKFPSYKHKKGATSFKSSNIECKIHKTKRGNYYCSFPKTKEIVHLGKKIYGKLIEVHVTPVNGRYELSFVFDDEQIVEPIKSNDRIIAIDPGINNLMAITNNCDLPCMLFNGKPLKSINQLYNKEIATIASRNTKGSTDKFVPTKRFKEVTLRRNNQVKDFLFKSVKVLMNWCVENRIDTIVLGKNTDWKQETNIGKVNNQNFVQIPHGKLYTMIKYSAERLGIKVIEQEESYTSKASFLDRDDIPTFNDSKKYKFSGKRIKRGLYKTDERIINADLNGSANILRKCLPNAFKKDPDFSNITVVKHPDLVLSSSN